MTTSIRDPVASTSKVVEEPKRDYTPYVSDVARTPYLSWATSAILLSAVPTTLKTPLGFPHLAQLPLFAAIFGGSGYMTLAGDPINGAGTTTAWSGTYLFLHAKKALQSGRALPIALTGAVLVNGAVHGYDYLANS